MVDDVSTGSECCPNCQAPLTGPYCAQCGQNQRGIDRYLFSLLNEFFEDVFSRQSRPARTLFSILFRPGHVTREYFKGRRASFVPPLRLYLITSIAFFFFLSLENQLFPDEVVISAPNEEQVVVDPLTSEDFQLDFLTPEENENWRERINAQVEKANAEVSADPIGFWLQFVEYIPQIMFFLLPLFALGMKVIYLGSGLYYTQHLILSVHNHCFLFIALLINEILGQLGRLGWEPFFETITTAIGIWIPVYIYLSLRTMYRQGYAVTFFKFLLLGWYYLVLFLLGVVFIFIWGIMSL